MIKKYLNILNFKKKNKRLFSKNYNKSENIVLMEIFDHPSSQICYSYFSNILSKLNNSKVVSIFPRKASLKNYLYNRFSPFSPYAIQKSYGSTQMINPKLSKKISMNIFKKINTKKDILKISLNKIHIGDLIYDEYLAINKKSTIDLESKHFKNYLKDSFRLFHFWYEYIKNNKVKSLILSHSVYLVGLPGRIAIHFNIPVYNVMATSAYHLDNKNFLTLLNFEFSMKKFLQLKKGIKKKLILNAKKEINNRFRGLLDIRQLNNRIASRSFSSIDKNKRVLNKNSKFKILVATHCFQDAVHVYGNFLFEDFFEWLDFLGSQSNKLNNYEWYLKCHPAVFDRNEETLIYFTKKYPNLILLPKNVTHNQLIYEGIGVALTVYGSIGHEYPLFGIPVVNASSHGPHDLYKFNFYPKTKNEYLKLIHNLPKLKVNKEKAKHQIYEYFAIRFLTDYNIYKKYNINPAQYRNITQGSNLYRIWMKEFSLTHHEKILRDYETFIKNKEFKMFALNNLSKSKLFIK